MSLRIRSAPVAPTRRLGRAATFAFGAAIAASTACSGGVDGEDAGRSDAAAMVDSGGTDAGPDGTDAGPDGTDAGPDGTDAGPDGTDAGVMVDAGNDAGFDAGGGITPLYGGIPSDGGLTRPDAGFDAGGGITPLYGGIPLLDSGLTESDAGFDAGGGITPLYGGSPSS